MFLAANRRHRPPLSQQLAFGRMGHPLCPRSMRKILGGMFVYGSSNLCYVECARWPPRLSDDRRLSPGGSAKIGATSFSPHSLAEDTGCRRGLPGLRSPPSCAARRAGSIYLSCGDHVVRRWRVVFHSSTPLIRGVEEWKLHRTQGGGRQGGRPRGVKEQLM